MCRLQATYIMVFAIVAAVLVSVPAHAGAGIDPIPVKAVVRDECGGDPGLQTIGNINIAVAGAGITATFEFDPKYRYLDRWYDFRWVNIITNATLPADVDGDGIAVELELDTDGDGCCDCDPAGGKFDCDGDGIDEIPLPFPYKDCPPAGAGGDCELGTTKTFDAPMIDPQPGQIPPAAGADLVDPFYWDSPDLPATGYEFAAHHVECLSSTFEDQRATPGSYTFQTFLVVEPVTAQGLPANHFWVLDGFGWSHTVAGDVSFTGARAPTDAALDELNKALDEGGPSGGRDEPNMDGAFMAWTAAPREDCPLQACPPQVRATCKFVGFDPDNPECCIFDWTVTHNLAEDEGGYTVEEFYLDLEAGTGGPCLDPRQPAQPPVPPSDVSLPGWTASYCYLWDNNFLSNWAVLCFMADGDGLQPGDSATGTLRLQVNGPNAIDAAFFGWHPFTVPPHAVHCHVTDYSPMCLGVDCSAGQFGPHIASDVHGRDQKCFWSGPGDWVCDQDLTGCQWDLDGDGIINAADLAQLLGTWGSCEGCPADFDGSGTVDPVDLAKLLGNWGPCTVEPIDVVDFGAVDIIIQPNPDLPGTFDVGPVVDVATSSPDELPLEYNIIINGDIVATDVAHTIQQAGPGCMVDDCRDQSCQVDVVSTSMVVMHPGQCQLANPETCWCVIPNGVELWPALGLPIQPGDKVCIELDPNNLIAETDETNNMVCITFEPLSPCEGSTASCCLPHDEPGCESPFCCDFVCSIEPFCCDAQWDDICVFIAQKFPECGCID